MKVVKEFYNMADAEIAKGFLESSGIKAFVSGSHSSIHNLPGAKLSVADPDFEKAVEILKSLEESEKASN